MPLSIPDGLRAKTHHMRRLNGAIMPQNRIRKMGESHNVDPKGGVTIVELVDGNGKVMSSGECRCSKKDNYNRRAGRLIATQRALYKLDDVEQARRAMAKKQQLIQEAASE